jgi:hypothetical protein
MSSYTHIGIAAATAFASLSPKVIRSNVHSMYCPHDCNGHETGADDRQVPGNSCLARAATVSPRAGYAENLSPAQDCSHPDSQTVDCSGLEVALQFFSLRKLNIEIGDNRCIEGYQFNNRGSAQAHRLSQVLVIIFAGRRAERTGVTDQYAPMGPLGSHVCESQDGMPLDHRAYLHELRASREDVPTAQIAGSRTLRKTPDRCSCRLSPWTRNTSLRLQ